MRIAPTGTRALRADGDIVDGDGVGVAHRTIVGTTADCGGMARAVGVWASLVLDDERRRAEAASARASAPAEPDAEGKLRSEGTGHGASSGAPAEATSGGGVPPSGGGTGGAAGTTGGGNVLGAVTGVDARSGEPTSAWPPPAVAEKPSPEHDWYLHHDQDRTLEAGAGVFLMTGTGGGALAGPSAFVVVEAGHGLFLRPSLAFGQSLTSLPPSDVTSSTWTAGRFDTCLRLPGLYTRHHGMQLDLCGGGDVGMTRVTAVGVATSTLPYFDLGPSLDLRGELGGRLSAVLRVVAGVNLLRDSFQDLSGATERPPLAEGRLELAFSWDIR
ncbi:MAG TPA: hypothetical protein VIY73_26875 [Polyangiaceae bacterium]